MNVNVEEPQQESVQAGGSFWKGLALGLGCQLAYVLTVVSLPHADVRQTLLLLLGLVQLIYLYPLAVYFQKRNQPLTSFGFIVVGILSLVGEAAWFGYAILHGMTAGLPSIGG